MSGSEDLKDDFPGATKGLLASIGLMLLFVGGDMIAEKEGLRIGIGAFILLLGAACFLSSWFSKWVVAHVLKDDAQRALNNFSRSRIVWGGVVVLLFQILIFSRFVEERRWPFSYPADPAVLEENTKLKEQASSLNDQLNEANEMTKKYRFMHEIRYSLGETQCRFAINATSKGLAGPFVQLLLHQLWDAAWHGGIDQPLSGEAIPRGITIRTIDDSGPGHLCAASLQTALTDVYPHPDGSRTVSNQSTQYLNGCGGRECVQIDIN
jgi:hypothetical protein